MVGFAGFFFFFDFFLSMPSIARALRSHLPGLRSGSPPRRRHMKLLIHMPMNPPRIAIAAAGLSGVAVIPENPPTSIARSASATMENAIIQAMVPLSAWRKLRVCHQPRK